jgi:hypothetical protein
MEKKNLRHIQPGKRLFLFMGPVPIRLFVFHKSDHRRGDRPTYILIPTLEILSQDVVLSQMILNVHNKRFPDDSVVIWVLECEI